MSTLPNPLPMERVFLCSGGMLNALLSKDKKPKPRCRKSTMPNGYKTEWTRGRKDVSLTDKNKNEDRPIAER
ncbi:hypothetical protein SK128_018475, partial [Halocaridina rubra]